MINMGNCMYFAFAFGLGLLFFLFILALDHYNKED